MASGPSGPQTAGPPPFTPSSNPGGPRSRDRGALYTEFSKGAAAAAAPGGGGGGASAAAGAAGGAAAAGAAQAAAAAAATVEQGQFTITKSLYKKVGAFYIEWVASDAERSVFGIKAGAENIGKNLIQGRYCPSWSERTKEAYTYILNQQVLLSEKDKNTQVKKKLSSLQGKVNNSGLVSIEDLKALVKYVKDMGENQVPDTDSRTLFKALCAPITLGLKKDLELEDSATEGAMTEINTLLKIYSKYYGSFERGFQHSNSRLAQMWCISAGALHNTLHDKK